MVSTNNGLEITLLPLSAACPKADDEMVEFQLTQGADVNVTCPWKGTALIAALSNPTRYFNLDVVRKLLAAGARLDELPKQSEHANALTAAVARDDQAAVSLLLEEGANPNLVNGNKQNALMVAARKDGNEIMGLLLACGGDPSILIEIVDDAKDDGLVTALEEAAAAGCESNVRKLIAHGAPINHQRTDTIYKDTLQVSSFYGQLDTLKAFIELNADVNTIGERWGTAVQAAATGGYC